MNARQLSGGNAFSPKVRIYDVGGNLVGYSFNSESSTTSETEVVFITSGEVEFIVIVESGLPEGAGTFRLLYTLEAGPFSYPVTNGSTLTNGEIHEGSISVPLEVDTWTFPSAAGDNIAVRLGETDNGTGLHPILQLFSPDGSLLASDSAPADGWVTTTAEMAGVYYVQITDGVLGNDQNDDTGSYRLEAIVLPGDFNISVGDEGGALTKGALHEAGIHVGDVDTWTIQAEEGDTIVVHLGEIDDGSGLTPHLVIRGPDGSLLDSDTAPADGRVEIVATVSGTYFVQVADAVRGNDQNDDTGSYRLEAVVLPGTFEVSLGDEGGTLNNGATYEGTIHVGDIDTWTIQAEAGNSILVRLGETDNGTGLALDLKLRGPDGGLLDEDLHVTDAFVTAVAEVSGTYFVHVADADTLLDEGDDTGSYRLESLVASAVFSVSDGDEGGPLLIGGLSEGTLSLGDIDPWTFEAVEEDRIRLQLITEGDFLLIKVFGPNGAEIASGQSNNTAALEFISESTGEFTVVVQSLLNGGSGDYDLTYHRFIGSFTIPENDPSGWGGWMATGAVWQIGMPTAVNGPDSFDGSTLAGTLLAVDYPLNANGLLASPPIFIPTNGLATFTYHQWFSTVQFSHYGQVQVRRVGEDWMDVGDTRVSGAGTEWAEKVIDLTPYAGDMIQIGFRFISNNFGIPLAGWFLDGPQLEIPLYTTLESLDTYSSPIVRLVWSGNSADGVITGYDVHVRTDDGSWELWLEDTLITSTIFQGSANRRYQFYVAARDSTGASIPGPGVETTAQAETIVILVVKLVDIQYVSNPMTVSFNLMEGEPGDIWNVQRSSSVKGPWTNAGIVTLDENGAAIFQDDNAPPPDIFYQALKPD
jgi:hypothetical protein